MLACLSMEKTDRSFWDVNTYLVIYFWPLTNPLHFKQAQPKGTPGFMHCLFKVASLATLNKQMLSSLATNDHWSLVNHKARLHLVWVHMVDICTALINSW